MKNQVPLLRMLLVNRIESSQNPKHANFKVVEQTKGMFYHFYVIVNQGRLFNQLKTIYLLCHFWTSI
jgi:aspartate/tyrosine/aromatic aminotransferase